MHVCSKYSCDAAKCQARSTKSEAGTEVTCCVASSTTNCAHVAGSYQQQLMHPYGISAAIRELEIYLKEYEIERQVWARRTPDVPYQAGRRTYLLLVGQAISDKHMTKLFQVVDTIHEAKFLGLIVVDELQA